MLDYELIGKRISSRRKAVNIKQYELAKRVGVSKNHLSEIENGKASIGLDLLCRICVELNVTPDYVILGAMHATNISHRFIENVRLCSDEEIEFVNLVIESLLQRRASDERFNLI